MLHKSIEITKEHLVIPLSSSLEFIGEIRFLLAIFSMSMLILAFTFLCSSQISLLELDEWVFLHSFVLLSFWGTSSPSWIAYPILLMTPWHIFVCTYVGVIPQFWPWIIESIHSSRHLHHLHSITCISYCTLPKMSTKINSRIYRQTGWTDCQMYAK